MGNTPDGNADPGLKRFVAAVAGTWFAGLLVLLPGVLTFWLLAWLVGLAYSFVGPGTLVGRGFAALGYPFARNPWLAYVIGTLFLFGAIYLLGLLVQLGLRGPWLGVFDRTLRRVPLVGDIYGFAERIVGLLRQRSPEELGALSPIWCFFGGDGAAVLGLTPRPEPLLIDGRDYIAVLLPTAPVPIGGALLYVPAAWVRPADIGMEQLTSVYLSMGMTPPPAPGAATLARPGADSQTSP
jgi:uncharacterized membrane protein